MKTAPPSPQAQAHPASASLHHEQLSSWMDGDLPVETARFLERRLEHDSELAGCQQRWSMIGEVLRGGLPTVAPLSFADRVALAVGTSVPTVESVVRPRQPWAWAAGGALAASALLLALLPSFPSIIPIGERAAPVDLQVVSEPSPTPPVLPDASGLPTQHEQKPGAVSSSRVRTSARAAPAHAAVPARVPMTVIAAAVAPPPSSPFALPDAASTSLPDVAAEARPWPRSSLQADQRFAAGLSLDGNGTPFAPDEAARRLQWSSDAPSH